MICFVPHEVLVECSINSYESPKPKDSLGLFSEMKNWTKTMNETNHILKRISSYSPPLQVCGKTKMKWRQHLGIFCAQAGFVIHFRYRTSGKRRFHRGSIPWTGGVDGFVFMMYIASSKWLGKNDPTGNWIHGLFKWWGRDKAHRWNEDNI